MRALIEVETSDRPGLLVDLVTIVTHISLAVESGEFDSEVTTIPVSKILNTHFLCTSFSPLKLRLGGTLQNMLIYQSQRDEDPCSQFTTTPAGLFATLKLFPVASALLIGGLTVTSTTLNR
nr:uridylyltransferase-related protein [Tanacetum cinerariifolium]